MRAPLPTALLASALMAGCGTGVYDAAGIPPLDGNGITCDVDQVVCANQCVDESVSHCGTCANDCSLSNTAPANAQLACLAHACDFECTDGFLKCGEACCSTTALAAGPAFTCALLEDATLRCWGANDAGQLGDGTTADRHAPVAVPLASAVALGAGARHACAIVGAGAVLCWGANDDHQVSGSAVSPVLVAAATPVPSGATAVVAGAAHTCALVGGAVQCWGSNALGQLGPGPGAPIASGATALAAGANHTCALVGGAVQCWGDNSAGQLGDGTTTPRPGAIVTAIATGITLVAASASQTCASTGVSNLVGNVDDVVRCWGSGIGATFLPGDPWPTPAIPMKDATHSTIRNDDVSILTVGRRHACYQKTTESVSCFGGESARGQLGGAPVAASELVQVPLVPVTVPAVRALATGADHGCAALGDGRLRCWGANDRGQLGDGDPAPVPNDPLVVVLPSGR